MAGRLVLVVGPSGAGKDTLIAAARSALEDDRRFVFVRRVVTRTAGAAEDHDSVSQEEFAAREQAGGFALSWRAHGLAYGVPAEITDELHAGHVVVVNVSREIIRSARTQFAGTSVVAVDATAEVRARRLAGRGRESSDEIEARLQRDLLVSDPRAIRIDNSGALADSASRFVAALHELARA
jgi:ribose 1,5-bisphosphokinase